MGTEKSDHSDVAPDLAFSEEEARYLVRSKAEIASVLRAVMQKSALVTAYFNSGNEFILTSLLDVSLESNEIVLDAAPREALNRKMAASPRILAITSQDRIKVKFVLDGAQPARFSGRPAFRARIPERLLRMQRREHYRIATPINKPLKCVIPPLDEGPRSHLEVIILDISCGGVAVMDHHHAVDFEPGNAYSDCHIELPDVGVITTGLEVRNTLEITLRNGLACKRSGCRFIGLPVAMESLIQRYIIKLQREINARLSGLR